MAKIKLAPCPVKGCTNIPKKYNARGGVSCGCEDLEHWLGPVCETWEQAAEAWNGVCGLWALGPEMVAFVKHDPSRGIPRDRLLAKLEALGIKE